MATLLRLGLLFYAGMAALAVLWRAILYGEPLFYASPEAALTGIRLGRDLLAGLAAGGGVLLISWGLTRGTRFGAELARALSEAVGPLTTRAAIALALASGIAEELLFRGALQPRVGWLAASLLFGLLHFIPRRVLLPWTVFAILAGALFGALFLWTGNLLAPIVAHVLVNGVNLPLLVAEATQSPTSIG